MFFHYCKKIEEEEEETRLEVSVLSNAAELKQKTLTRQSENVAHGLDGGGSGFSGREVGGIWGLLFPFLPFEWDAHY